MSMKEDVRARTSRKLLQARRINVLRQKLVGQGELDLLTGEALDNTFLFHLWGAYCSLLSEILYAVGINVSKVSDLDQAITLVEAQGIHSPELNELKALESGSCWLTVLLQAFSHIHALANHVKQVPDISVTGGDIGLISLEQDDVLIKRNDELLLEELQVLVEKIRGQMIEC